MHRLRPDESPLVPRERPQGVGQQGRGRAPDLGPAIDQRAAGHVPPAIGLDDLELHPLRHEGGGGPAAKGVQEPRRPFGLADVNGIALLGVVAQQQHRRPTICAVSAADAETHGRFCCGRMKQKDVAVDELHDGSRHGQDGRHLQLTVDEPLSEHADDDALVPIGRHRIHGLRHLRVPLSRRRIRECGIEVLPLAGDIGLQPDVPCDIVASLGAGRRADLGQRRSDGSPDHGIVPARSPGHSCEERALRRDRRHGRRGREAVEHVREQRVHAIRWQRPHRKPDRDPLHLKQARQQSRPIEPIARASRKRALRIAQDAGVGLVSNLIPHERKGLVNRGTQCPGLCVEVVPRCRRDRLQCVERGRQRLGTGRLGREGRHVERRIERHGIDRDRWRAGLLVSVCGRIRRGGGTARGGNAGAGRRTGRRRPAARRRDGQRGRQGDQRSGWPSGE